MILLSILILSIPSRRKIFLDKLLDSLEKQIKNLNREDIEILVLYDNKKRTVGEKRTDLLNLSRGKYLTFIDDDDIISEDYLSSIITTIDKNIDTDCIVYDSICTINDGPEQICHYGIELEYNHASPPQIWTGKPAHTMVFKSSLVKPIGFPTSNYGEDMVWVRNIISKIKTQIRINKVLYYYKFNSAISETR